jgi:protein SCO1
MFLRLIFALFFAALLTAPAFSHLPGPPKKGEAGRKIVKTAVPDFTLTDQDGRAFRFGNLRGKVVLVTFIFTTCPDFCPLLTAKLTHIQQQLEAEHQNGYFLLSITTDPDTDKPAVLKSYSQSYKADLRSWAFLAGDKKSLSKVWDIFGIKVKRLSNGQIQHTGLTILIDRDGLQRVNYYGDRWQEKEVLKDIAALGGGG